MILCLTTMVFQVKKVENHISKIIVHCYFMILILNTLTNVNNLNLTVKCYHNLL